MGAAQCLACPSPLDNVTTRVTLWLIHGNDCRRRVCATSTHNNDGHDGANHRNDCSSDNAAEE
jgi:hypothetical protein